MALPLAPSQISHSAIMAEFGHPANTEWNISSDGAAYINFVVGSEIKESDFYGASNNTYSGSIGWADPADAGYTRYSVNRGFIDTVMGNDGMDPARINDGGTWTRPFDKSGYGANATNNQFPILGDTFGVTPRFRNGFTGVEPVIIDPSHSVFSDGDDPLLIMPIAMKTELNNSSHIKAHRLKVPSGADNVNQPTVDYFGTQELGGSFGIPSSSGPYSNNWLLAKQNYNIQMFNNVPLYQGWQQSDYYLSEYSRSVTGGNYSIETIVFGPMLVAGLAQHSQPFTGSFPRTLPEATSANSVGKSTAYNTTTLTSGETFTIQTDGKEGFLMICFIANSSIADAANPPIPVFTGWPEANSEIPVALNEFWGDGSIHSTNNALNGQWQYWKGRRGQFGVQAYAAGQASTSTSTITVTGTNLDKAHGGCILIGFWEIA